MYVKKIDTVFIYVADTDKKQVGDYNTNRKFRLDIKKTLGTVNPLILQTDVGTAWEQFHNKAVPSSLLKISKNSLKKCLANMTLGIAGPALERSAGTGCTILSLIPGVFLFWVFCWFCCCWFL